MPLKVTRRSDTGALTITGTLTLPDRSKLRVRARAQSDDPRLAAEEAATLEARLLRDAWHGERRGARSFAEAVVSYLKAAPRHRENIRNLNRLLRVLGDVTLAGVDQAAVDRARDKILAADAAPSTVRAAVITPIRAVLNHAFRRGWCDKPHFEIPRQPQGRTLYLRPAEARRLVDAAAPHLQPLLVFLLCTGARLGEALALDWRDVDLQGARAILWADTTKTGRRRNATLPPAAIAALGALPRREGPVFRWDTKPNAKGQVKRSLPYHKPKSGGGQIKTAFAAALRRAGLDVALTPHALRHSWASWHYALDHDLLKLKQEGGWSSLALVERYAHLMPAGHDAAIRAFWGLPQARTSNRLMRK